MALEKVLCVDDEPAILAALRRTLRNDVELDTAEGAVEALEKIATGGPYAVIVCDMSMPVMGGVELLREVEKCSPDTVRIMLTGHTHHRAASAAINEAHVFRFLVKPCGRDELVQAIQDGLHQYRSKPAGRPVEINTLVRER